MITFSDGPAAGKTLMLSRAPRLLRVVRDPDSNEWDALDLLTDEPTAEEEIFVYQRDSDPVVVHVSRRPRSQSGWYMMATYRVLDPQPTDAEVRTTEAWRRWCEGGGSKAE